MLALKDLAYDRYPKHDFYCCIRMNISLVLPGRELGVSLDPQRKELYQPKYLCMGLCNNRAGGCTTVCSVPVLLSCALHMRLTKESFCLGQCTATTPLLLHIIHPAAS
jgi:hypothetical protein